MKIRSQQKPDFSPLRVQRLDVGSIAKNAGKVLLMLAAVGAVVPLAVVAPNLPKALVELGKIFNGMPRARLWKALRRLQKRRLVEVIDNKDGTTSITLTEEGKKRVLRFNFEYIQIPQPDRWDGLWRMVTFDVPETLHRGRRALRMKIRELGFYPLQKSVFVYPYPCKDEIDFIADYFQIGRFLNYIEARWIDDEEYLKQYFRLPN